MLPTWTSSLRLARDSAVVGVCMAALAWPAASFAAGGTPMPGPDDPPTGFTTSTATKTTTAAPAPRVAPKRAAESAQAVPTPDAPIVAASAEVAAATTRQPAPTTTPTPTPDVSRSAAPPSTRPRPVTGAMTPPSRSAGPAQPAAAKPATRHVGKGRAKAPPKAEVAAKKNPPASRPPASRPRDAVRLGLPVGVLGLRHPDNGLSGALLLTAAILLAAAACGSTVLGVAARSAMRQA